MRYVVAVTPRVRIHRLAACLAATTQFVVLTAADKTDNLPVVELTADDSPDFRYQFLERVRTTKAIGGDAGNGDLQPPWFPCVSPASLVREVG